MEKILLDYLKKSEGQWFKKVNLYVLADDHGYSPETAGRALRDLAEKGKIKVDYYNGKYSKNLAKYSYNPQEKKTMIEITDLGDGRVIAVQKYA